MPSTCTIEENQKSVVPKYKHLNFEKIALWNKLTPRWVHWCSKGKGITFFLKRYQTLSQVRIFFWGDSFSAIEGWWEVGFFKTLLGKKIWGGGDILKKLHTHSHTHSYTHTHTHTRTHTNTPCLEHQGWLPSCRGIWQWSSSLWQQPHAGLSLLPCWRRATNSRPQPGTPPHSGNHANTHREEVCPLPVSIITRIHNILS